MDLRRSNLRGLYRMFRAWGCTRWGSLVLAWDTAMWCYRETRAHLAAQDQQP